MGSKRKNVDGLTKDLEDVIRKLYTQMQGTYDEKREAIIQKVGTSIESVEKARQEKQGKIDEYRRKKQEEAKRLKVQKREAKLDRFKQRAAEIPDDIETLMQEFNYKQSSVFVNMKSNGIYGKNKILQAIKEKAELGISEEEANAQIAKEGNVTLDAVVRIRNQEKERQAKIQQDKEAKLATFKQRTAEIPDDLETLRKEFGYSKKNSVLNAMAQYGVYNRKAIRQAIKEKAELGISEEEANAQIAEEGNVTLEAVARIRNQEKEKEKAISSKQTERKEARKKKKQEQEDRVTRFKQRAGQIPDDIETLMQEFNYMESTVFANMKNNGIYTKRRIVQAIREKTELGISEEEANAQIAREGNITVQAVVRIRNQEKERSISSKQTEQKEAIKQRKQEKENRIYRFKQRAAEIPDDIETLKKEFEYSNKSSVLHAMTQYGIYNRKAIRQAIQEKAELGISEEEANAQIAEEGNVTVQAVARIRQGISKPKTKSTRANVKPSSTQTPSKPIAHTKNTKPRVKPNVANIRQKAKQVQKNEIEEARQREIEQKRLEEELQQVVEKNAKREQAIKQESEVFLKMAREFWPSSSIQGKFQHIDDYDMILIRRKHKILSREEVEELIETTSLSDEEIAQKANGVVAGVKKVRESIRQRQELIARVSDTKRNFIIELIKKSRIC